MPESDPALLARLRDHYPAKVERGVVIALEGFDWNCPQHITPASTEAELVEALDARPRADCGAGGGECGAQGDRAVR